MILNNIGVKIRSSKIQFYFQKALKKFKSLIQNLRIQTKFS